MTKPLLTLAYCALTFSLTTYASQTQNLDLYHNMIEAQRDTNGNLIQLVLKPTAALNSDSGSTNDTASIVLILQDRIEKLKNTSPLANVNSQSLRSAGWNADDIKNYSDARNILNKTGDVQKILSSKIVNKILREFEKDVNLIFQYNVLAKPGVPGYFHDRALIDKAYKKALSAAENVLGTTPAFRAVNFLLNMSLGWVEEKRSYSQNILLFYMEKVPASDLGFTAEEISFIKSSIFERDIALWDFQALAAAKKNWAHYGAEKFAHRIANNSARLAQFGSAHGSISTSFDFAFTPSLKNNVNYILNTQDSKSKLSSDLSIAYDGSAPQHIRDFRIEMQLTQLASSLLPIPNFVLGQLHSLIGSYYGGQKVTEGALYADLLSQGKTDQAQVILHQSINPILIHDLK